MTYPMRSWTKSSVRKRTPAIRESGCRKMSVQVKLFGKLQRGLGEKKLQIEARAAGELLEKLWTRCGERAEGAGATLEDEEEMENLTGELRKSIEGNSSELTVLINGRNLTFLDGPQTKLEEGDRVAIFPPTGGG